MRKIKFRQHLGGGKFHYWGFIGGKFIEPATSIGVSVEEIRENSKQFTGLLDKSGKEIYEGDIVRWIKKSSYVTLGDPDPETRIVKWDDDQAGFDLYQIDGKKQQSGFCMHKSGLLACEVVGNINEIYYKSWH